MSARVRTRPGEPLLVVDDRPRYLAGANYAWHRYGEFGESLWGSVNRVVVQAPAIDADLGAMRGHGARAVRWFLFTDGRSGIRFSAESGLPSGLADGTIDDIAAALAMLDRHGLLVVFSIVDYLAAFDRARPMLDGGAGGRAFVDRVLAPVFDAFGRHDAVLAWEVMNEPDWIVAELNPMPRLARPVPWSDFAGFVRRVADAVHQRTNALVTVGGARAGNLEWWKDASLDLDFLQVHLYYSAGSGDLDLYGVPASGLNVDRPMLIGEVPGRNDPHPLKPRLEDWLAFGLTGGYAGVWPWAFTSGPGDRHAPYDGAAMRAFYGSNP